MNSDLPRFYFTAHPSDATKRRTLAGAHVMLVAAAAWDHDRERFRVNRPPADHLASICIDSGGFTAMRRWGRYPWTPGQYADWIRAMSEHIPLDFCAVMDYACEPAVNRSVLATNIERVRVSVRNDLACRRVAPDLPWLSVLQGDTLRERAFDLRLRHRLGLVPTGYAGIGSVCGRGASGAREAIKFYLDRLPGVRYHAFGLHIQALDDDTCFWAVRSWDSYSWNWGKGQKNVGRPDEYLRRDGETWSTFVKRLAGLYRANTITPRLQKPRTRLLL